MRKTIRCSALRAFHLFSGIAIGAFVYSPTLQSSSVFEAIIQFGILPALGLSGLIMWRPRVLRTMTG